MGLIRSLFKRKQKPMIPDKTISNVIAFSKMTLISGKPYFTIDDTVWSFKDGNLVSMHNGGIVTISPEAHMFLNAHLNTVPVVSVN